MSIDLAYVVIEDVKKSGRTELDLRFMRLKHLPYNLTSLKKLQKLYLGGNQLVEFPTEILQLENLKELYLSGNQIRRLPSELGQLKSLEKLDLETNQLCELPSEIGTLENLKKLYLSDNLLKSLPAEICNLKRLEKLNLEGNPIETPPLEIVEKGIDSIKNYLWQLITDEKDYLYEAKLIIVGEPGAGKTTLAKKIEDQNYQLKDEISTKGIDVIQWKFPNANARDFKVNIWDFGGQEIYHATHQFFLTKRSLYVLVADTRKDDTDFFYWCNIVALLSDNSPLLIVKNEKQDRHREINERQIRGKFTNFKETFATNLATNRGLSEIIINIKRFIKALPHIGSRLPKKWIKVREILEQNRHRNYISLEKYLDICEDNGFTLKKDKLQLSGYLHDLGVCLHFQEDPVLKNTVIINPEWGTDAVYKVLDNDLVIRNLGKFTKSDLDKIWNEDKYAEMQDELFQLMIKFQLCYEIPESRGNYIAPQLLTEDQPDYNWDEENNLFLRYEYVFMPKGIITRFIVAMHSTISNQKKVWKSGVVLEKDGTWAEIIEYYDKREIKIRVIGKNKRDLMTIVIHELDKIHNSYHQIKYNKMIPCNCETCMGSKNPHFFQLSVIKEFIENNQPEIQCHKKPYHMVNVFSLIDDDAPKTKLKKKRMEPRRPVVKCFISYAHFYQDYFTVFRDDFEAQTANLRFCRLEIWTDEKIPLGENWHKAIQEQVASCDIAILLVSDRFMTSDHIKSEEVARLFERKEMEGTLVISVYFYPCRFRDWLILKENQLFKPKGEDYGRADQDKKERFCFADLVKLDNVHGKNIASENPDRSRYMMDFVEALEPRLKEIADRK